jgi:hypothetical protein
VTKSLWRRLGVLVIAVWVGAVPPADAQLNDKPTFQIVQDKIELYPKAAEPEPLGSMRVRNTGKTDIAEIDLLKSNLTDSNTRTTIQLEEAHNVLRLSPGQTWEIPLKFSPIYWAGNYTGSVVVSVPGADEKSVTVIVHTRGPLIHWNWRGNDQVFYWSPYVFFVLTVIVGFALSSKLDVWMGTDLPRAQAIQSLRSSEEEINKSVQTFRQWRQSFPSLGDFPIVTSRLSILTADLLRILSDSYKIAPAQLAVSAQSFYDTSSKLNILVSATQQIASQFQTNPKDPQTLASLTGTIKRLDGLDFTDGGTIAAYRNGVVLALTAATSPSGSPLAPKGAGAPAFNIAKASATEIGKRIRTMTWVNQSVIWAVVAMTAYSAHFATNWGFGTGLDYINMFLWSLGLTQAGKQLIARAH